MVIDSRGCKYLTLDHKSSVNSLKCHFYNFQMQAIEINNEDDAKIYVNIHSSVIYATNRQECHS